MEPGSHPLEDLLRTLAPQVLGVLARRHGQFDACEDAVQEALLEASLSWPRAGIPDNPHGWLLTVAGRRLVDQWRSESSGLLALMLLTDARRSARTLPDGGLVPLAEQDRSLWDTAQIREGVGLLTSTLGKAPVGPYQLQAAIAAIHDEAPRSEDTDWPQILALYDVLERIAPSPVVTLNRAVAVAMVKGPLAGLALLGTVQEDPQLTRSHRLDAVRAHLLELTDVTAAREAYLRAASSTASLPERRYLAARAARLG